ncbi:MAG TPA: ABC transporter permease [Acidimicrobiia bacterium]
MGVIGLAVFFVLPLAGLLWRVPWSDVFSVLGQSSSRDALRLSLETTLAATALSVVFGVPLAWLLARMTFRGRGVLRALALLPLVLPPVVGGVALFYAFGRRGLVGQWIERWFHFELPFSIWAVILAETFVAMPFLVITVEGALRGLDTRYEDAAAACGAGRWTVMRRVTLPMIGPSILAGMALTWARALGEFGATITFAGSFPGKTQTLPLAIYLAFENGDPAGIVLSLLLLVVSMTVLVLVGSRVIGERGRMTPSPSP